MNLGGGGGGGGGVGGGLVGGRHNSEGSGKTGYHNTNLIAKQLTQQVDIFQTVDIVDFG